MTLDLKTEQLNFDYPEHLVAKRPVYPPRVLGVDSMGYREVQFVDLIHQIEPGDLLVVNNTKVEKRRIFLDDGLEILFVRPAEDFLHWEVLFPAKRVKDNEILTLPGGIKAQLISRGLPQKIKLNQPIETEYFSQFGELALPPYIQQVRDQRHTTEDDDQWYQTAWAKKLGSTAAPTASLHFKQSDIETLKKNDVQIHELTLHVGLGTFLPIKADRLNDHQMHSEWVHIPHSTIQAIRETKQKGRRIWAMGTTVTRSLESLAQDTLPINEHGDAIGSTDLFIKPGYEFKIVDCLMTNFHQPESTLLALVFAFAGLDRVKEAYDFAIRNEFRLFSYGDLTLWKN